MDAQVTEFAGSDADVFFDATTLTPLAIGSLVKAQSLGSPPEIFLPSTTSAPGLILEPGGAGVYPKVYTTAFAKSPLDPAYAEDDRVMSSSNNLGEYASSNIATIVPQCVWAYGIGATLAAAFERMQEPTRAGLMKAIGEVRDVEIPLLLVSRWMPPSTDLRRSRPPRCRSSTERSTFLRNPSSRRGMGSAMQYSVTSMRAVPEGYAWSRFGQPEYTDWLDESLSWKRPAISAIGHFSGSTASHGPDALRLLSDFTVNSMASFAIGQSKHAIHTDDNGKVIHEGVLPLRRRRVHGPWAWRFLAEVQRRAR